MFTLLLAKTLAAPSAEFLRFVVFFALPLAGFTALEARALKDLGGSWKLLAFAPALLLGAVVYLLAADALIALLLGREPQESLFVVYLLSCGAGAAVLCLLLAGHRLSRRSSRPSTPVAGMPGTRYRR